MEKPYVVDQKFEKESTLVLGEYEHCLFKNCSFESADFKNFRFVDCTFESCNLSLVKLSGSSLQKVHFNFNHYIQLHIETLFEIILYAFGYSILFFSILVVIIIKVIIFVSQS